MLSVAEESWGSLHGDPRFLSLVEEYKKASLPVFDAPTPNYEHYAAMDAAGQLNVVTARSNGDLVGFTILWVYFIPHHIRPISTIESIFILPEYRGGGGAQRLLDTAHAIATRRDCQGVGMSVSVVDGPAKARAMQLLGFTPTHQMLFKPCTN